METGWIFHKILDLNLEELFFEEYRCEYSFVRSILKKRTIKYRKSDRNRYVSSAHSSTAAFLSNGCNSSLRIYHDKKRDILA